MVETSALKSQRQSLSDSWMLSERNIYICHDMGNIPDNSGEWLHTFVDFLSVFLNRISKAKYNIYFSGIKHIDVKNVIDNTRAFIFILKSDTLKSQVFAEETKLIQSRCSDNEKNILLQKVLASPISEATQSSFLSAISAFDFFDPKAPANSRLALWMDEKFFSSKVILEQLADLAYQMESFFGSIPESKISIIQRPIIYLAETTKDQVYNRETLKREIEEYGFKVLPDHQLPQTAGQFRQMVENYLEDSSVSIHIIGSDYGEIPQGEVHSTIDIQNKIAAGLARNSNTTSKHFSRLIWIAPNLQVANDLQKRYIEHLKHDGDELANTEIIQSPLEEFKSLIMKRLKKYTQVNHNPQNNPIKVYIINEETDIENAKKITIELQSLGISTVYAEITGKQNLFRQHRQYLVECEAVLIYNSNHNPTWLNSKITDCLKAPGYGKKNSFMAKMVLMSVHPDNFGTNDLRDFSLLPIRDNITDTLQPLLNKLIPTTNNE